MTATAPVGMTGSILVIDDDDIFIRVCDTVLTRAGFTVDAVTSSGVALERIRARRYDAIVSDIRMPGADGVELLRAARSVDPSVPFVLMTGSPTLETAIGAVEHGALRYLPKPFDIDQFVSLVSSAVERRVTSQDLSSLERRLDRGLNDLWMAYQPIVRWSRRGLIAYEALVRSAAPEVHGPGDLLELAENTHRLPELGRAVRNRVAMEMAALPNDIEVFVNLHPQDLSDDALYDPAAPLSRVSRRVVLEITERASLEHLADLPDHTARLRSLGFRIAVDDLGAGYAGLNTFASVKPEFVKIDASLVRGIDGSRTQQLIVSSVLNLARELEVNVIAEAIETRAECASLVGLGVDLMQGYLFAKPGRPFVVPPPSLVDDA